jgi:riboflavin kinase/FMN adenylyltransferase
VVTIGVFDGVHQGHRVILGRALAAARRSAEAAHPAPLPVVVVTFDPHPSEVVRAGSHPAMLSTVDHRAQLLHEAGADGVLVLHFSPSLARLTPEEFVRQVLVDVLHARVVVVGANFRFGHRAVGTVETLDALGATFGFSTEGVSLVAGGGVTWSSTYVRQCVAEGDVEAAAAALGRPHRVEGVVVHGDHRGRELGYPTANLTLTRHAAVPADGVYAGHLIRSDGKRLPAAISIGTNPTFEGSERRVEAFVLDMETLDVYGEHVALDVPYRLRDTLRFDSVEELLIQIADDVSRTRELVGEGALACADTLGPPCNGRGSRESPGGPAPARRATTEEEP